MNDGSGLQYLLTDQLGSVVAVTDSSGTLISQQRYMPFGQVRTDVSSGTATDLGFTGQRNLDAQGNESLGLMDYNARMYDAVPGRFIQPDTIIPSGGPQNLNRYSYVLNNPVNATDPTGHRSNAENRIRQLKRDYGRCWKDVRKGWHCRGNPALTEWSDQNGPPRIIKYKLPTSCYTGEGAYYDPLSSINTGGGDYEPLLTGNENGSTCNSSWFECTWNDPVALTKYSIALDVISLSLNMTGEGIAFGEGAVGFVASGADPLGFVAGYAAGDAIARGTTNRVSNITSTLSTGLTWRADYLNGRLTNIGGITLPRGPNTWKSSGTTLAGFFPDTTVNLIASAYQVVVNDRLRLP